MTDEEVTRFALQLSQAERIRAQIAEDEATANVNDGHESQPLVAPPTVDQESSMPAVFAA